MPARIFNYESHDWVCGLFWQPISGEPKKERPNFMGAGPEVRNQAERLNSRLYAWREGVGDIPHAGFLDDVDGIDVGSKALSAASAFAHSITHQYDESSSFVAALELPNKQWYFLAQREGVILPDGDKIGSEDEILSDFHEITSVVDWDLVIAPEHWGITNSTPLQLDDVIPYTTSGTINVKEFSLYPVKKSIIKPVFTVLLCITLIIGGSYGYHVWSALEQQKLAQQHLATNSSSEALPPPPPWHTKANALDATAACLKGFNDAPIAAGHWRIESLGCTPSKEIVNISGVWDAGDHGRIDHIQATHPSFAISLDGRTAIYSAETNITSLNLNTEPVNALPNPRDAALSLISIGQKFGSPVQTQLKQQSPVLPGQDPNIRQIPFTQIEWTLNDTIVNPNIIIKSLDKPGLRLDNITLHLKNGLVSWSIKGVQYAQ